MANLLGHESLLNANVLHCDISIGNIMLERGEDDGFLIDLDLAIRLDRQKAPGAPSKTGTKSVHGDRYTLRLLRSHFNERSGVVLLGAVLDLRSLEWARSSKEHDQ